MEQKGYHGRHTDLSTHFAECVTSCRRMCRGAGRHNKNLLGTILRYLSTYLPTIILLNEYV